MSLLGKLGVRAAAVAAVFGWMLFCGGCGDTYRPVANPVLQPGGDPQRTAHAVVVSSNGANPGHAVVIDVSGDTVSAIVSVGRNPVQASFLGLSDYVVNQADNNVDSFVLPTPTGTADPNNPNIISLPAPTQASPNIPPASPSFSASAGGKVFVTEPGLVAPFCSGPANCVADISPVSNTVSLHIPVGRNPVALVATPDGTQLYCLNKNDGTVSVILPATDQVVATVPVGSSPVWGAVNTDGTHVFIVNEGSNTVSVINTANNTVIGNPLPVGVSPNYITYQPILNRFYVTAPGDNSLTVINNNIDQTLCAATPSLCVQKVSLAGAPCNGQHAISVTPLADGTRAYVADDVTNSVCVLNTTSNTFTKRICLVQEPASPAAACVGAATPVFTASNSDATRVYAANQYSTAPFGITSVARTNSTTGAVTTGVVTVTTSAAFPFVAGDPVTIAGVSDSFFNGVYPITSVNAAQTQFTFVQNGLPDVLPLAQNPATATAAVLPFVSLIQTTDDSLVRVLNSDGSRPPLTIPALGLPVFIAMTP